MIILKNNNKTLTLRDTLFWDVDKALLDAEKSKRLIIERVLTRGNMEEFKQLKEFYTLQELKDTVIRIGSMDAKTLNFISDFLNISKEDFLCYKKKLSSPTHWNC
jgi:hypothetical protein